MGHDHPNQGKRPAQVFGLLLAGMIALAMPVSAQVDGLTGQASGAAEVAGDIASATGSVDLDAQTDARAAAEAEVADALAAVANMQAAGPVDALAGSATSTVSTPVGMLLAAQGSTSHSASADVNASDGIDVGLFYEACAAAEMYGGMDFVTNVASGPLAVAGSASAVTDFEEICHTLDYELNQEVPELEVEAEAEGNGTGLLAKLKAAWSGFRGLF